MGLGTLLGLLLLPRRFYLAFDHNDALYEKESFRQHVEAEFGTMLAAEVRRRGWRPAS